MHRWNAQVDVPSDEVKNAVFDLHLGGWYWIARDHLGPPGLDPQKITKG